MAAAFGASAWLQTRGLSPIACLNVVSVALVFLILGLERLLPYRTAWNQADGQLGNDIGHLAVGTGVGGLSGKAVNSVIAGSAGLWLTAHMGGSLWPRNLPIWVQVILVYLIADLGRYVQHRWMHVSPLLWRFHALHHSATRLYTLKSTRSHIVERFLQPIFMFGPLVLLGAPSEVLYYYMLPNFFLGMFDHSNVDLRLGLLEYVVMSPNAHRIHHAKDERHGMTNFGSALVLWDIVFGTFTNPLKEEAQEIGIKDDSMPPGFIDQIADPFRRRRSPESSAIAADAE
jgi:sterol desaturase/sphingolipid hydroxylase (fatty acid hydroxylase superfamily)